MTGFINATFSRQTMPSSKTTITRTEYRKRLDEYMRSQPGTTSGLFGHMARAQRLQEAFDKDLEVQGIEIDPKSLNAFMYTERLNKFLDANGCHGFSAIERRQALIKEFDEQLASDGYY